MSKKLYVGNLPFSVTEADLRQLFSQHGEVDSVSIVMDRDTGRPRGFGFVEMASGADEAIRSLNATEYGGRNLTVNEARPRENGGGGGGAGGGGRGAGPRRPRW